MSEILGWIGNVFFVLGSIFLAKKQPIPSLLCNLIANGFYVAMAILLQTSALLVLSVVLIGLNVWGIYTWNKARNSNA